MTREWKILWISLVAYGIALAVYSWFAWQSSLTPRGGQFGEAFGAFSAAFSGLGLIGLAFAIYLQHRQLQVQSEELRLQREELALTREQLARSAQAQEESEKALRNQLRVMALSSRLTAVTILIREEEAHLRDQHQMTQIDSMTVWGLEQILNPVQVRIDGGHPERGDICLRGNLADLISLRKDLKTIHDELRNM